MRKVNVDFTMLLDQKRKSIKAFGIGPMPTTFFIKPNGKSTPSISENYP